MPPLALRHFYWSKHRDPTAPRDSPPLCQKPSIGAASSRALLTAKNPHPVVKLLSPSSKVGRLDAHLREAAALPETFCLQRLHCSPRVRGREGWNRRVTYRHERRLAATRRHLGRDRTRRVFAIHVEPGASADERRALPRARKGPRDAAVRGRASAGLGPAGSRIPVRRSSSMSLHRLRAGSRQAIVARRPTTFASLTISQTIAADC